jgi:hypothetical protein
MRVQVLYWQEIPSVIKVTGEDGREARRQLPDWFQQEIDRLAMEQGLVGSDAYLEQWEWRELDSPAGAPAEVAETVEADLLRRHAP